MAPRRSHRNRDLTLTLALTATYCVVEFVGGWWTNSLALLSDAGHMFADVAALGLSVFAVRLAERPPTATKTFGYHRVEILAALLNAFFLWIIVALIAYEAVARLRRPAPIGAPGMIAIATVGLLVNLLGLVILRRSRAESLNVHAAFVHVLGDTLGSIGAMVAGGLIAAAGWLVADPITSLGIGALILYSSWEIITEAVDILMQSTPRGMQLEDIERCLLAIAGVRQVHDLHVWTLTSGKYQVSVHLVTETDCQPRAVIDAAQARLHQQFGIAHSTVQVDAEAECAEEFRVH